MYLGVPSQVNINTMEQNHRLYHQRPAVVAPDIITDEMNPDLLPRLEIVDPTSGLDDLEIGPFFTSEFQKWLEDPMPSLTTEDY
jgi:hypothetical protein